MGNTNFGNQIVGLTFGSAATALISNFVEYGIVPTGIYQGGLLSQLSPTQISVAPLICFIDNDSNAVGIRIETTSTVTLTVSSSTPFIVIRFAWINSNVNYMDVLAVDYASIQSNDLIVGRCIFSGGNLQTIFDYSQRTNGWSVLLGSKEIELIVSPTDPVSNTLNVSAGTYLSGRGFVTIATGISPSIPSTILGRNDLLYVDAGGLIQVNQGIDSASPSSPDYRGQVVLAEIHRGLARTNIRGDELTIIKDRRYSIDQSTSIDYPYLNLGTDIDQVQASSFTILDPQSIFSATDIENALLEVGNTTVKDLTIEANQSGSINAGDVVVAFPSNQIRKYNETLSIGATQLVYTTSGTALNEGSHDTLAPGVIIYAFYNIASPNSAVKVVVITTSGKVATPGTVYEIENFTNNPYRLGIDKISIKAISSTKALLVWNGGNIGSSTGRAVVLTITGSVVTWNSGDIITFNTGGTSEINMVLLNSTHALVVYIDGSVNKTTSLVLTISGTTTTAGAKYQPDSTQRVLYRLKFLFLSLSSGKFISMILWDDGANLHTQQISVDPASSYAISWNAIDGNGISYITNKDQAALLKINDGAVYYLNDDSPSMPTEILFSEGSFTSRTVMINSASNFIPRGLFGLELSTNTHIIFGSDSSNSNYGTIMLYRMKNGELFTSTPQVIVGNAISYFTKLAFLDLAHVLCIWYESTFTLLKCAVIEITNNFDNIVGVSKDNGFGAGHLCNVFIAGITDSYSALDTGNIYYLKTDGTIIDDLRNSTTEPVRIIGKALSTTELQFYEQNYY